MELPSAEKCGRRTLRSNVNVSTFASPPFEGATARCCVAYQKRCASICATYVIHLPSGDQAGWLSAPGLVVICVRCAPLSVLSAATTQILVSRDASGSGMLRLLVKASCLPSGDQAGCESSNSPEVICVTFFFSMLKT